MKLRLTPDQTDQALRELGVDPVEFALVQSAPSHVEAIARLTAFKLLVKKKYREAALRLHPDRTEGDPAKQELFCLCTQVYESIQELRLQRPVRAVRLILGNGLITINVKVNQDG